MEGSVAEVQEERLIFVILAMLLQELYRIIGECIGGVIIVAWFYAFPVQIGDWGAK